jgi:hypothetical protein
MTTTCHAIIIHSECTTRYRRFRATDGRELIGTFHDTTASALLDYLMDSEDVYMADVNGQRCWRTCAGGNIVAYKGDTTADFGDYTISIWTAEEAQADVTITNLINA